MCSTDENDTFQGIPGRPAVKNLPGNARDTGFVLVWKDPTCCRATEPVCPI